MKPPQNVRQCDEAIRSHDLTPYVSPSGVKELVAIRELRDAADQLLHATMYKNHPYESQRLIDAIAAYDAAALEQLGAQAKGWIPVTERLPKSDTPVLMFGDGGQAEIGEHRNERCCMLGPRAGAYGAGFVSYLADGLPVNVTHWMPLPAPPIDAAMQGKP